MRLKDKVCIVTGIGAGIGESIAMRFAEEGAKLLLNDINPKNGQATLDKVKAKGAEAVFVQGDVSKEEDGKRLSEEAVKAFGTIDVVVNNAADFTQKGVEQAEWTDWLRVFSVNVFGPAMICKYAIPHMKAKKKGSIVNVASMSGIIAQHNFATYNSSKGAVMMLTRCMALDLAPFNIRVNTICPGCILTSASFREIERDGYTLEEWTAKAAPKHMLGRLGEPVEVANAAVFLASDEASFITADHLMVDGGYVYW